MSEVRIPGPVRGRLVESVVADDAQPGDFKFYIYGCEPAEAPPAGLHFVCPCGCGGIWAITFRPYQDRRGPIWSWDGNRQAPDCNPSIQTYEATKEAPVHWHGFLRHGSFVQA